MRMNFSVVHRRHDGELPGQIVHLIKFCVVKRKDFSSMHQVAVKKSILSSSVVYRGVERQEPLEMSGSKENFLAL